jgi:glycosidase
MQETRLELLVYGQDAGLHEAAIRYDGVSIIRAVRAINTNYLFLELEISEKAIAGEVAIDLTAPNGEIKHLRYELRDHSEMAAGREGIVQEDLMYLIMPDRFSNGNPENDRIPGMLDQSLNRKEMFHRHGGDLHGVINHLDHLSEMGVTALWLNPVWENNEPKASYHGYAPTDIYKIDPRLGTEETYAQLISACHQREIKIVKDIVYNHWGANHFIMKDLPDSSWINTWPRFTRTNYRAVALSDPYASENDLKRFTDGWFDGHMPDLNQRNPHLANYLIQHSIWWAGHYGIDAYRIDTYAYPDQLFMQELMGRLKKEFPNLFLFGETWVHGTPVQSWFTEPIGTKEGLESVTDFQLHYAIQDALNTEPGWTSGFARIYYTLAKDRLYEHPDRLVTFLDNHDLSRIHAVMGEDVKKTKMALALLMTLRGVPCLYYGTEIGMANFADPDGKVREDFPGGWSEDKVNKFSSTGRDATENELFTFVSKLGQFRKLHPQLFSGAIMQFIPTDNLYTYFRYTEEEALLVVMNRSGKDYTFDCDRYAERLMGRTEGIDILTGEHVRLDQLKVANGGFSLIHLGVE